MDNCPKKWDVFISHAGEDREEVAAPLAAALTRAGFKVWLDTSELRLGDSLRERIDEGLAESRFGVVILSPSFFSKHWPQRELNGLFARDIQSPKVLLPVWHNLDATRVATLSPLLADRKAVNTAHGLREVTAAIIDSILSVSEYSATQTPLRTFNELLEEEANASEVREFLANYPAALEHAVGAGRSSVVHTR